MARHARHASVLVLRYCDTFAHLYRRTFDENRPLYYLFFGRPDVASKMVCRLYILLVDAPMGRRLLALRPGCARWCPVVRDLCVVILG